MKVVVSQPFYLPWPGLFDQIRQADLFVHYDDVQLPQGRSFCSRVQIKTRNSLAWLSVPLVRNSRNMIRDALIDNSKHWRNDHLNNIKESLSKADFYSDALKIISEVFDNQIQNLSDLNIMLIEAISGYLGLKTKFMVSSSSKISRKSTEKLLELCKENNASSYITGHGAKNYLNHELFEENNIDVRYMQYNIKPYSQFYGEFTPYVTILDLIAHKGPESIQHLQSTTVPWRAFLAQQHND